MIDADSRYAVSTQVTALCVVCSSCWTVVSTGINSDCNSAKAATPMASTAKVTAGRPREPLPATWPPQAESAFRWESNSPVSRVDGPL